MPKSRLKIITNQYGSWGEYADFFGISLSTYKKLINDEIIPRPPKDQYGKIIKKDNAYIKLVLSAIKVKKLVNGRHRIVLAKGPRIVSAAFYAKLVNVCPSTYHRWIHEINLATGQTFVNPPPKNEKGRIIFDEGYVTYLMSIVSPKGPEKIKVKKEKRVDTSRLLTHDADQYQQEMDKKDKENEEKTAKDSIHKKGGKVFYKGVPREK